MLLNLNIENMVTLFILNMLVLAYSAVWRNTKKPFSVQEKIFISRENIGWGYSAYLASTHQYL
jgi:hypothetical protein